jgi:hypothetical protein
MFEKSERPLCGFKETHMTVFDQANFQYKLFTNFSIINLGLDPDQDWIRVHQQAGYGSIFIKIPRSGYGFSEYGGSETLAESH